MLFYQFWRSIASFRVRIVLNLKGLHAEAIDVDLLKGHQREAAYRAINPQMVLPALVDGKGPLLFQSMAIMEYLEEVYPEPELLPDDAFGRARVRGLCMIVIADAHPMSVPRMRGYLVDEAKLTQAQMLDFVRHWQTEALVALETHLSRDKETGRFCHGDTVTLADVCVGAHAVGAGFFDVDVKRFPTVSRIVDRLFDLDEFANAHPLKQPGAPEKVSH